MLARSLNKPSSIGIAARNLSRTTIFQRLNTINSARATIAPAPLYVRRKNTWRWWWKGRAKKTSRLPAPKWQRAQAALGVSEANQLELKRREEDVQGHVAEVNRARSQMDITQSQINDTSVYSPIDGVVLVKSAEVGEVLAAGTTVVTIGDLDHPWLRAYVNETDLGKVKLGAPAKLTIDSYPGRTYNGRVSFIASEAEFTPKQIQTKKSA